MKEYKYSSNGTYLTRNRCKCSFAAPWHEVGKAPNAVILRPWNCPKCGIRLTATTIIR